MDDPAQPPAVSLDELYDDAGLPSREVEAILDRSLEPRGRDMLFDLAGQVGLGPDRRVLDAGCRDGRHLVELARRFGCPGVGVELVAANLRRGRRLADRLGRDEPAVAALVRLVQGRIERLPFRDGAFDLVWVRDMLVHVPDLVGALAECRRVLAPGGRVLVFQMFATPWLEPGDAARLWPALAVVPQSTDPVRFELAVAGAGLRVAGRDEIGSEWRERAEEDGTRTTSRQLLWTARLLRDRERLAARLGRVAYQAELANCLWGVYQMIGKLSPRVYQLEAAPGA